MNRTCASILGPSLLTLFIAIHTIAIGAASASGQTTPAVAHSSSSDLSWVRDFAVSSAVDAKGRENDLNGDSRFHSLLQSSLHQHQSFWFDHYRLTPVADLVHTFIGVPGDVLLDQNRYVTADGCVPHDCGDRGMVWIDTGTEGKGTLIFVATGLISNGPTDKQTLEHLWLFSSTSLNWQKMPEPFLSSLARWNNSNLSQGYPEQIVLVTLVQPTGQMVDLSTSLFSFSVRQ